MRGLGAITEPDASVTTFIKDRCDIGGIPLNVFYSAYVDHCQSVGMQAVSAIRFGRSLSLSGIEVRQGKERRSETGRQRRAVVSRVQNVSLKPVNVALIPGRKQRKRLDSEDGVLRPCHVCGSRVLWRNDRGEVRCGTCDPPVGATKWITLA